MKFLASIYNIKILALCLVLSCLFFACKKDVLYPTQTIEVATGAVDDINNILFINDSLGYIVGGSKYLSTELLTTKDGGTTWQRFYLNGDDTKQATSIAFNGSKVIAAGYAGKIYTPIPNSTDWQTTQSAFSVWYQHIAFSQPNKGILVYGEAYATGGIYAIDSSLNIHLVDTLAYQLCDVEFANAQIGYTCGYGAIMKTEDGGDSWALQNIQGDFFRSLCILDVQNVWAAGYNGSIVHTKDGGAHWEKQRNGDNPLLAKYRFRGIAFKDINTGYAVGDKGLIMKTTDGGEHWSQFEKTTDKDLRCITLVKDGSLWIGGADGLVLHINE
jgi:photosystem II stability/assembly factor-like uncharacterized protein